ncbi:hypothetical protein HNH53_004198 [Escherichia fergusonii]|nr:hypothetical protein [Escherichia fergusonii]EFO7695650.1 hypothetical protein [Escherichia fergusonii]EHX5842012.1 glucosyltransferase domain-containing protein [Escherichia fergusonii]
MSISELIKKYRWSLTLGFIYVLPIIIANKLYIDDLGRSADGYFRLSENGRPLADAVLHFLSFGVVALDISPYTLLISVVVIVLSTAYFCEALGLRSRLSATILPIALLISPNFLENLSYKFDSVTMGLSVAAIVFPVAFTVNSSHKLKFAFTSLFIVLSLCLYQASINLIASVALIEFYIRLTRGYNSLDVIKTIFNRAAATVFGYALYSKLVVPFFVIGYYNTNHSDIVSSFGELTKTLDNLIGLSSYMFMGVGGLLLAACFIISVLISWTSTVFYFENTKDSIITKLCSCFILIVSPFAILICTFGSLALLRDPVLHPRVLIGSGGVILFSFILVCETYYRYIKVLPVFATIGCFSISAAYGNTLTAQSEMERNIAGLISNDINSLLLEGNSGLFVNGKPEVIPSIKKIKETTPIIQLLVPNNFKEKWVFSNFYLASLGVNYAYVPYGEGISRMRNACEKGVMKKRALYSIGSYGKMIFIDFNKCK